LQLKHRRTMTGTVVAARTAKTVVVAVLKLRKHPLYKKIMRRTKKFHAHNETFELAVGTKVKIREVRPISKTKHFEVIEIV